DPDLLCEPQLAIVGTRNPTPTGRAIASEFAEQLTSAGLVITSGLALGIDAAGHEGALAAGGSTIAVLGTGPDRIYPARNQSLARAIAEQGALVTELPPGTTARAEHFPRRNRLISGLTLGTLVIEAAPQSGSLITARLAAEQGREVFAVPGSVRNPVARGCHQLLREGARLVESSTDVLQELAPRLSGLLRDETTPEPAAAVALEPVTELSDEGYRILLDRLDEEPTAVDTLVERTGLTADVVSSMLLILELHGYVSAAPGGRYRRVIFEGH
ncbi:MAG: DNA-processing protein DprA, partial [Candidatus Competibacterales bacterium]|nr:DNA-processing protein DprA [Candidatus Competibacterales bacterium]